MEIAVSSIVVSERLWIGWDWKVTVAFNGNPALLQCMFRMGGYGVVVRKGGWVHVEVMLPAQIVVFVSAY